VSFSAPLKLSRYVRLTLIILTSFTLGNLGLRAFGQSTAPPANPFLQYPDLLPGQPASALQALPIDCTNVYYYSQRNELSCSVVLASGIFDRIDVFTEGDIIRQTNFTLRDHTLKLGDLLLFFDGASHKSYPHKAYFSWAKFFIIASTTAGEHTHALRPIWNVTFTDTY
jgi:hypothetical protein